MFLSQNRAYLWLPPVVNSRKSYQMEIRVTSCDPEEERSRKILQLENDWTTDFRNVALAREVVTGSTFSLKIAISGLGGRQKLRIRIREAVAAKITKIEASKQNIMLPGQGIIKK